MVNKTPKVVSVGCVGLWKINGVLSDFGKIRENQNMVYPCNLNWNVKKQVMENMRIMLSD